MNDAERSVGIAVAQFAPGDDTGQNLTVIDEMTATAAARGARVVVFPEYASYFVDPFDERLAPNAQTLDGPFVGGLRDIAARNRVVVVAGLLERGTAERVRNTVIAVDDTGIVALYRKAHLYDAFGQRESEWIEPGSLEPPQTFVVDGLRFGLLTCYDLRFPESARVVADAGADVALIPAEWVRGPLKEHHWRTLATARAIENMMYVAGADHPPPLGVGNSLVIDPQGVAIAGVGTPSDVAVGFASCATIDAVRRVNPALALRRYEVQPR